MDGARQRYDTGIGVDIDVERLDTVVERHLRLDLCRQRAILERVFGAIRSFGNFLADGRPRLSGATGVDRWSGPCGRNRPFRWHAVPMSGNPIAHEERG